MFGTLFLVVALVIVVACVGISLLRGFSKSILRGATVVIAALASIITCLALKAEMSDMILETLLTMEQGETISELGNISPTLLEVLTQLASVLIAPLACLVFFFLFWFILGIVCFIVSLILRGLLKKLNGLVPLSRLWAAAVGLVEGLVIAGMLFLPITGYMSLAKPVVEGMVEQEILEKDEETEEILEIMNEIDQAPVIIMHRTLGGQMVADSLMSFEIGGESVSLREEIPSVLGVVMTASEIGKTDMQNFTDREVELLASLGDSITESKLIAPIVGDILYGATDAWLEGETFLDMEKPTMDEEGVLTPFMDTLLQILHDDAKTPEKLQKDLHTFADVMSIFVENGVMDMMGDSEKLAEILGGSGIATAVIETLEQNESMEPLIDEVMEMGMTAISQVLIVPEGAEEKYGEFMDDVALALNDVAALPKEERVAVLTEQLNTAFAKSDVNIDDKIVEYYANDVLEDLVDNNDGPVTEEDVRAYFEAYTEKNGNNVEIPQ